MLILDRILQNVGRRMRIITVLGALAAVTLVSQAPAMAQVIPGYPCPASDIDATGCRGPKDCLYPHPTRCDRFVQCNDAGIAYDMPCPQGHNGVLHFNPKTKECDYPQNAGCVDKSRDKKPPESTEKSKAAATPEYLKGACRQEKPGTIRADDKRCECFYKCDDQHVVHFECCNSGLLYRVKDHSCAPASEVQCGQRTPPAKK